MEDRGAEFFERVRQGFLTEAQRPENNILVIDADREPDAITQDILAAAERVLAPVD